MSTEHGTTYSAPAFRLLQERLTRAERALQRLAEWKPDDVHAWVEARRAAGDDLDEADWAISVAREALEDDRNAN